MIWHILTILKSINQYNKKNKKHVLTAANKNKHTIQHDKTKSVTNEQLNNKNHNKVSQTNEHKQVKLISINNQSIKNKHEKITKTSSSHIYYKVDIKNIA